MIQHALLLTRAYELLRLTRQVHNMSLAELEFLNGEIDDLLKRIDPEAHFDDPASLEEFKRQSAE